VTGRSALPAARVDGRDQFGRSGQPFTLAAGGSQVLKRALR